MSPRELLGESDSFAEVALPDELGSSVQDLSHVFGAKQVFTSEQWGTGGHIVIAACTDTADVHKATTAQFGVVAVGALSEAQLEKARAGKYRDYIGCTKGSFR